MLRSRNGYLYVILSAFFYSMNAIFGKYLLNSGIKPMELSCIQFGLITLMMLCYVIVKKDRKIWFEGFRYWKEFILFSSLEAGTTIFFYMSLMTLNAGVGSMLLFTHPVFVAIFFIITGIRKISWVNRVSLFMAIVGSALTLNAFQGGISNVMISGVIFGVLSSMCYAFYNIFYDLKLSNLNTTTVLIFGTGFATILMCAVQPSIFYDFPSLQLWEFGLIATMAFVSGVLPAFFLYKGIKAIGSDKATIISTFELPVTLLIAFLVLSETLELGQIIGVMLIVTAVIALQQEDRIIKRMLRNHYTFGWENDNGIGMELIEEIKTGQKTATCGFKDYYEKIGDNPYNRKGKTVKVLDRNGKLHCRVVVTDVFETPVNNPSRVLVKREGFGLDTEGFIADCKSMWEDDMPGIPFNENAILIAELFSRKP